MVNTAKLKLTLIIETSRNNCDMILLIITDHIYRHMERGEREKIEGKESTPFILVRLFIAMDLASARMYAWRN